MIVITQDSNDHNLQRTSKEFFGKSDHLKDTILVLGGDGTLLRAIHEMGLSRVFVPINMGTLGFLMNPRSKETSQKLFDGDFKVHSFPLLHVRARYDEEEYIDSFAVNDAYIERDSGQTARLYIDVDNQSLTSSYPLGADGIIISSSLGSTAYNFSAGGQISHPLVPLMNLTPICPHLPKIPPMSLSIDSEIRIYPTETEKRPIRLVIDGTTYRKDFKEIVVSKYNRRLCIAYLNDMNFVERLFNKIIQRS